MTAPTFSVPAKKMAMWLFIIADSATFAGCLVAYGFTRNATPDWPRPFHGITNVAVMTLILLTSSLTMMIGVRSAEAGNKSKAFLWTMITAGCGADRRARTDLGGTTKRCGLLTDSNHSATMTSKNRATKATL